MLLCVDNGGLEGFGCGERRRSGRESNSANGLGRSTSLTYNHNHNNNNNNSKILPKLLPRQKSSKAVASSDVEAASSSL
jgi:hypothetical protein